jgi:hypothetical protein
LEFAKDLPYGTGFAWWIGLYRVGEIVPRGTIAAPVTGVDGDLRRISALSGPVLDWDWLWMRFDQLHRSRITSLRHLLQNRCG